MSKTKYMEYRFSDMRKEDEETIKERQVINIDHFHYFGSVIRSEGDIGTSE